MGARITAVVFDMFETLVPNDPEQWVEVFERVIRDQRLRVTQRSLWSTWKKHEVAFREARLDLTDFSRNPPFKSYTEAWTESFDLAFKELGVNGSSGAAVRACLDALGRRVPYPDTVPALEDLRRDFRLGLLSNADDAYLDAVIGNNGFRFDATLSSEQARTYKPDPRAFRDIARLLRVPAAECVYVGDRQFEDVLGSRLSGMRCIWLKRADTPLRPDLPAPDTTVSRLTELRGAIASLERAPAI